MSGVVIGPGALAAAFLASPEERAHVDAARAREERIAQARDAFLKAVRAERRAYAAACQGGDKPYDAWTDASVVACAARDAWLAAEAAQKGDTP